MNKLSLHVVQIFAGVVAILMSVGRRPLTYRFSNISLPDQHFMRTVIFVLGVALILGGLWGLWLALHASPRFV